MPSRIIHKFIEKYYVGYHYSAAITLLEDLEQTISDGTGKFTPERKRAAQNEYNEVYIQVLNKALDNYCRSHEVI